MRIGFIGIGVMGASIVQHLLRAGHEMTVYTRTKEKAKDVLEQGAIWASSPKELARNKDIIFTMVGLPNDVRDIYFGENGLLEHADQGTVLIDMTTSTPSLAKEIDQHAKSKYLHSLDVPVSGGDIGAQNGTLSLMVGGEESTFKVVRNLLEIFSSTIVYQGTAGSGQHAKMCNQILAVNNLIGVCESIAYAMAANLNVENVLKSIATGAAGSWAMTNLGPKIIAADYNPGFFVKHMLKDLTIAQAECESMRLTLPGLQVAKELFEQIVENGYGNLGTQALAKHYVESYLQK